ncbi:tyrosine-type recombinase/integrase [Nocardioides sp. MH1]|uniref:tyrosine-type recombinase/integrase n=1 Tax=Nocardioides sp. MH1 TaxID=3242490 RepID=UPI0035226158
MVFAREDGNPIHPERVSKRFGHPVTDSGSPPTRLHDLRHARASLSLASGTDIALVSKILGHSSISVSDDSYAPLRGRRQKRCRRRRRLGTTLRSYVIRAQSGREPVGAPFDLNRKRAPELEKSVHPLGLEPRTR